MYPIDKKLETVLCQAVDLLQAYSSLYDLPNRCALSSCVLHTPELIKSKIITLEDLQLVYKYSAKHFSHFSNIASLLKIWSQDDFADKVGQIFSDYNKIQWMLNELYVGAGYENYRRFMLIILTNAHTQKILLQNFAKFEKSNINGFMAAIRSQEEVFEQLKKQHEQTQNSESAEIKYKKLLKRYHQLKKERSQLQETNNTLNSEVGQLTQQRLDLDAQVQRIPNLLSTIETLQKVVSDQGGEIVRLNSDLAASRASNSELQQTVLTLTPNLEKTQQRLNLLITERQELRGLLKQMEQLHNQLLNVTKEKIALRSEQEKLKLHARNLEITLETMQQQNDIFIDILRRENQDELAKAQQQADLWSEMLVEKTEEVDFLEFVLAASEKARLELKANLDHAQAEVSLTSKSFVDEIGSNLSTDEILSLQNKLEDYAHALRTQQEEIKVLYTKLEDYEDQFDELVKAKEASVDSATHAHATSRRRTRNKSSQEDDSQVLPYQTITLRLPNSKRLRNSLNLFQSISAVPDDLLPESFPALQRQEGTRQTVFITPGRRPMGGEK